jgi:hypothetical protein
MRTKILFILALSGIITFNTKAQEALTYNTGIHKTESEIKSPTVYVFEFTAYSRDYELDNITTEMAGEHPFGDQISKKVYLLESKYTSEVALIPGNPQTKTVIQKPVIYETVKRIEKQLKKSVKKEELSVSDAAYTFNKVLDVALNTLTANTERFESAIESLDETDAKIDLFTKRVNLIY